MQLELLTALTRASSFPHIKSHLRNGDVRNALAHATAQLCQRLRKETAHSSIDITELATLCGDLQLALNQEEDADESYRLAVKHASTSEKGKIRVASNRHTAFLRLHHQQPSTSVCFERIFGDDAASSYQKIEALCGMAICFQAKGQFDNANSCLKQAQEMIPPSANEALSALVQLVRLNLAVRALIRSHEQLSDHVYWQNGTGIAFMPDAERSAVLSQLHVTMNCHRDNVIVKRGLTHLLLLLQTSFENVQASSTSVQDHLQWLRKAGLVHQEYQARIDLGLLAITHKQEKLAGSMLTPMQVNGYTVANGNRHWRLEISYCLAKLNMLKGMVSEALESYQAYAREAITFARHSAVVTNPGIELRDQVPIQTDDVEARLPAKYRKAYRYMLEHLGRSELSVRELADMSGVTERALQLAFRASVGMTPVEVMQRSRVERIRAELLQSEASSSIPETAARWGIRNRSTLLSCYRKYFQETPAQTLQRRVVDSKLGLA